MATINLDNLKDALNKAVAAKADDSDGRDFRAPYLTCCILDPDGNEVGSIEMEPRAFKPKDDGQGGIGWDASFAKRDKLSFRGLPLNGGLRVSVDKLKIGPGDLVDIRNETERDEHTEE